MKLCKILIILCILLVATSSYADPWDRMDKTLFTVWIGTRIIDLGQTHNILTEDKYYEKNDAIAKIGEEYGSESVYPYFAVGTIVGYLVADMLPSKWRKSCLLTFIVLQANNIIGNENVGIGMKF